MNLELTNVGKISNANIEFNGITVIAGENNTGKSTIGKMLFCVFHSFYRIKEQIKEERVKSISRVLDNFNFEYLTPLSFRYNFDSLVEDIVERREEFLDNIDMIAQEIEKFYLNRERFIPPNIQQVPLKPLAEKVNEYLKLDDNEIMKIILHLRLEAEFAMNVGHLNNVGVPSTVKLNIKNSCIDLKIDENKDIIINSYMDLNKEIIYIDDPFVLDSLDDAFGYYSSFKHSKDLLRKIEYGNNETGFTMIDKVFAKKKIEKILAMMNDVCDGNLSDEGDDYVYKSSKLNGNLGMVNLSTGLKSFVILRQLLLNGNIDENGIIILDEPEIHLHPEWQLKFAESIVLIQKEFDANILLNTHSPYFLNAIEVYSKIHDIKNKCRYYLIDENDGNAIVTNVTDNTEAIYAKLAKPLQELENLEYRQ